MNRSRSGFVLVYVAALLALMAGAGLVATKATRSALKIVQILQEQATAKVRLDAIARLISARIESIQPTPRWNDLKQQPMTWLADNLGGIDKVDGTPITISLQDAGVYPDANMLREQDWETLLTASGVNRVAATDLARKIIRRRSDTTGGFRSVDEIPLLSSNTADALAPPTVTELRAMLTTGTGTTKLHVQRTPLPLFALLPGADPAKLQSLAAARKAGKVTPVDIAAIFGVAASEWIYSDPPTLIRADIDIELVQGLGASVLIATADNGTFKVRGILFGPRKLIDLRTFVRRETGVFVQSLG